MEASPGIEPGYKDLQSSASPLRHEAIQCLKACGDGRLERIHFQRKRIILMPAIFLRKRRIRRAGQERRLPTSPANCRDCAGAPTRRKSAAAYAALLAHPVRGRERRAAPSRNRESAGSPEIRRRPGRRRLRCGQGAIAASKYASVQASACLSRHRSRIRAVVSALPPPGPSLSLGVV